MPILINSGMSESGWSGISSFLFCQRLYYLKHVISHPQVDRWPLIRGSVGHVALAHVYARKQNEQQGRDPEEFYPWETACEMAAQNLMSKGECSSEMAQRAIDLVKEIVPQYIAHWHPSKHDWWEIVGVEMPVRADVQDKAGRSYPITQRLDLVIKGKDGKVYLIDHKWTTTTAKSAVAKYSLSAQFLLMANFGRAMYGAQFGGTLVNLVGVRDGRREFSQPRLNPVPGAIQDLPLMIANVKRRLEVLAAEGDPSNYVPAFNEQICGHGMYGSCEAYEACQWNSFKGGL